MQAQLDQGPDDDLRHYVEVIGRRKWLILGVTLLVGLGAFAWSTTKDQLYRTSADLLLFVADPGAEEQAAPNDPERAMANEIRVLGGADLRSDVVELIGDDFPSVSASATEDADAVTLTAEGEDPEAIAQAVNAYVRAYRDLSRRSAVDQLRQELQSIQRERRTAQDVVDGLAASRAVLVNQINLTPAGPERDALVIQLSDLDAQTSGARAALLSVTAEQDARIADVQARIRNTTGGVQVLNLASPPGEPFYPEPMKDIGVGLAIGLMMGLVAAFALEQLDDAIRTTRDIDRATGGVPLLARIPQVPGWKDRGEATLVMHDDLQSPVAEAYRGLVTSLEFLMTKGGVFLFSSPSASEGKTTSVANLGVAFAEAGHATVVVDADLRRPRVHRFYGLSDDNGLTHVLSGKIDVAKARRRVPDRVGLDAVVAGPIPPNPTELLRSEALETALAKLADSYDVVLIDCPPVLPVSDVLVISRFVDAVVMIVSAGSTSRRQLSRAVAAFARVNAPLKGVVLNGVEDTDLEGYAYYEEQPTRAARRGKRARA